MKHCQERRLPAQPHTRHERLVWARKLNTNFQSKYVNQRENGTQANNFTRTGIKQQQLLAEGHVRRSLDWTGSRGVVTRYSYSSTQPRYPLCQPIGYMRHKQQKIQQIYSRTG